jgi:hypothetical protein
VRRGIAAFFLFFLSFPCFGFGGEGDEKKKRKKAAIPRRTPRAPGHCPPARRPYNNGTAPKYRIEVNRRDALSAQ